MSISNMVSTPSLVPSSLPKHYTKHLDNGLQIVVVPLNNKSGVIETNIFYKVGSRNEVMGKSGIAHMLEHLSFKSTDKLKAGEFDEIVKGFGGVNNASTSFDYTRYFIKSSVENLDKSLELFSELMSNLLLKEDEFEPERNVVAEERLWRTDNSPMGYLYFRFFNTAFVYHPYHWTPIGFMQDIQSWNIDDIRSFYRTYYQPQNAIVLVSGDIEPNVVFQSATQYFGKLKNTSSDIPQVRAKEPKQDGMRRNIVKKDSQVEFLAMAYNMDMKDESVFLLIVAAKQGVRAEKIEEEVYKILENIKKGHISQEELDKVKVNTRANFIYSLENSSEVAGLFGSYLVRGDIKPLLSYERDINTLNLDKIQQVANKYFVEDTLSVVILKDKGR